MTQFQSFQISSVNHFLNKGSLVTEIEKQIQDLLVAVIKMEKTQESSIESQKITTDNVDKLITHMDKLLPVHTEIANIKKILYSAIVSIVVIWVPFGAWMVLELHRIDNIQDSHIEVQKKTEKAIEKKIEELNAESQKKIHKNENQITY